MIRSLYTVNRNMNLLQKQQENTSGNLANANTSGYKFKSIMQSTLEAYDMSNYADGGDKERKQELGEFIFGNRVDETIKNFSSGTVYDSQNFTDFALGDRGFFTIELSNGQRGYTRNGNFIIGEDDSIRTQNGQRVLGINNGNVGPIYADENFRVDNRGFVMGSSERFLITDFADYDLLEDRGDTIFTSNRAGNIMNNPLLMQNYLEASNVDFTKEMVKMIEISREFESNQKMIQTVDETLSKTVNDIGRL